MNVHTHTPDCVVIDARRLSVRQIRAYRSNVQMDLVCRIVGQTFDVAGRQVNATDARIVQSNTSTLFSLTGETLLSNSVDAGWRLVLVGEGGQPVERWDNRGLHASHAFDDLMRPIRIVEGPRGQRQGVIERFTYGDASPSCAAHNQCGRLIRRDDGSGTRHVLEYGVAGAVCVRHEVFWNASTPLIGRRICC